MRRRYKMKKSFINKFPEISYEIVREMTIFLVTLSIIFFTLCENSQFSFKSTENQLQITSIFT